MSFFGDMGNAFFGDDNSAWGDNQGAFNRYSQQMRQNAGQYQPWIDAGMRGMGRFENESGRLLDNPNFLQDMISGGFSESPFQRYMQDMTTRQMNMNAANTGMLGSGASNRALQNELTSMTGQFLNDYINRGMGSYNQGFEGMGKLGQMGLGALGEQSNILNEAAGGELQGARSAQGAKTNKMGTVLGGIGSLFGMGGDIASMFPGWGSAIGAGLKGIGGLFNGGKSNGSTFDLSMGGAY